MIISLHNHITPPPFPLDKTIATLKPAGKARAAAVGEARAQVSAAAAAIRVSPGLTDSVAAAESDWPDGRRTDNNNAVTKRENAADFSHGN